MGPTSCGRPKKFLNRLGRAKLRAGEESTTLRGDWRATALLRLNRRRPLWRLNRAVQTQAALVIAEERRAHGGR
jgi:hypothetical protein